MNLSVFSASENDLSVASRPASRRLFDDGRDRKTGHQIRIPHLFFPLVR